MEGDEGTTNHHQASSPAERVVVAKCRMYEAEFPERDELVMIRVLAAEEFYYRVALLEYNDREGIILRGELSGSRDRAMRASAQRVGKEEVARVVRVDQGRGYIDLSSLRPHAQDSAVECSKRYRKAKAVHCIMTHAAELLLQQQRESENGLTLEQLYQRVGWPLYAKYGHAYDAFEKAATGEEDVFEGIADVPADIKHTLLQAIQRHPQPRPTAASATPFSRPDSPVGSSSTIIETHDT